MRNTLKIILPLIAMIAGTLIPSEKATSNLEVKSLQNPIINTIDISFLNPLIQQVGAKNTLERAEKIFLEPKNYDSFKYQDEIPQILKHAKIVGVETELLMAIRTAEGAADHLAYGIKPGNKWFKIYHEEKGYLHNGKIYHYVNEKEKQLSWAAYTIRNNLKRFGEDSKGHNNFISYLASIYAPIGASNDPTGLNVNWEKNVKNYYNLFKRNLKS